MFGNLKSGLKSRLKGVVEDIKGRRVDAAEPYVAPPVTARPTPIARPTPAPRVEAVAPPTPAPALAAVVAPKPVTIAPTPAEPPPEPAVRAVATEPVAGAAPPTEPVVEAPAPEPAAVAPAPVAAAPTPAVEAPVVEAPVARSVASLAAAAAAGKVSNKVLHADMGSTDMDAYVARAKANGRDVASLRGGIGLNHADDGEAYWGPVDNDSSRAKAAGKVLSIDQFECISCGTCVEQTDKVYYLPDDGKATPIAQDGPMDLIQDAIDACPVTCIHWVRPEEAEERGLATGTDHAEG